MEEIKANAILEFNDNQLFEVRKSLGYDDVNKLKQDIEQLDDWIKQQNHFKVREFGFLNVARVLKEIPHAYFSTQDNAQKYKGYLERMLINNKGSIERTKQKIDKLCTCVNLMPDFLQKYDIKNEFTHMFNVMNICVLPKPTKDNYRIIITNANGVDDNGFTCLLYYRYYLVMAQYMLHNDYSFGYEAIADLRNMTLHNVGKMNPIIIHKGLTLIVDAMGQRVKKIHMISGYKLFDTIVMLYKQGLSAKLKERLVIHSNIGSLHKHFSLAQLPKDLGGEGKTIKELNETLFKELCSDSNIANIKFMESASTDESLRLACKFNEEYSGTPGSFKSLCVD